MPGIVTNTEVVEYDGKMLLKLHLEERENRYYLFDTELAEKLEGQTGEFIEDATESHI